MTKTGLLASAAFILSSAAVHAQTADPAPLPTQYKTMLDDAVATGSDAEVDAVAKFIKRADPAAVAAVDSALAARKASQAKAAEAARLAELEAKRGLFAGWKGEGQAGAFQSTGNSSTTGVSLGLALTKEGEHWRHNLRALTDYQRSNGVTSRNQLIASYEPNYKFNDRLFAYGLGQYERDRFQGFNSRVTASGGLGYRVIATDTMTLDVKAGPAWRKTNYITGIHTSHLAGLAGARFDWKISKTLGFSQTADALFDSSNTSLASLTALDAKLGGAFTARVSYQVHYESSPPAGVKKTDTLSRLTLVYGF